MGNQIFQRIEKKYLLDDDQYESFMRCIEPYMQLDEYGLSTICNIYYDTDHFDLIRRSIDKPVYKEKFRIRSYGVPRENSKVFLEIKKKYDGVVYKRREIMTLRQCQNYLMTGKIPEGKDSQIMREIDYCIKYYDLKPALYLAYDREAYYGKQDKELRMTFDINIRSRQNDLDLAKGDAGELLLRSDQHLLEIKIPQAMPMWLVKIMNELEIYPVSFSKYGTIYSKSVSKHLALEGVNVYEAPRAYAEENMIYARMAQC